MALHIQEWQPGSIKFSQVKNVNSCYMTVFGSMSLVLTV